MGVSDLLRDRVIVAVGTHYDVEAEIGRGGMAVVYRALDLRLHRHVAVKVLPPELAFDPGVRSRFLREAQTAAQLGHPNIVPIHSVDEREGISYFVMGLVEGESLAARLAREGRLPVAETVRILREVADALAFAHGRGVIHRDVKPDNILLERGTGRAMVTDFGIARAAASDSRLTVTGVAIGTPAYMSPEQALGEHEIDARSDIYSLGIVGYQMLAGEPPFKASNTPAMLMKQVTERPRALRERRPDVPASLAGAIERALAKASEDRWATAADMRDALLTAPPYAPPPPAVRAAPQLPGPVLPAPPGPDASRRDWRDYQKRMRRARDHADLDPEQPLPARIASFRRAAMGSIGTVAFLSVINLTTSPHFPWAVFPAMGIFGRLVRRWDALRSAGLRLWDVLLEGEGAIDYLPGGRAAGGVEGLVRRFWRRAKVTVVAGSAAMLALVVGASWNLVYMIPVCAVLSVLTAGNAIDLLVRQRLLARGGVGLWSVLSGSWRERTLLEDPAARAALLEQEIAQIAPPEVLAGRHGAQVRQAVEDRRAILEVVERLSKPDRAMLPDVAPTVRALVERVATLAQSVHRIDASVDARQLDQVRGRVESLERTPASADRDRRLTLLQRQRTSLEDLLRRRDTLVHQIESAGLALQNLRLDLLKLRSSGLQASLGDVTSATQEARALSREISNVLEAAAELKTL